MDERDEQKVEGLLKARSANMGRRRASRRPRPDPRASQPLAESSPSAPARACEACGGEISPRRLRAMPAAIRCLDCQRAYERAPAPS